MSTLCTHKKRPCTWCEKKFRPATTISPRTTEHYCSPACALASMESRTLSTEARERLRGAAVAARRARELENAARLAPYRFARKEVLVALPA